MSQAVSAPHLVRALRRRDFAGIMITTMIGSGMLAAPAKVFALAHGWSFLVLGLAVLLIIPPILCFADLASRFSGTGGPYLYARATLPSWLAFCTGWSLWLSQCFSLASLTNLLFSYLSQFAPVLGAPSARAAAMAVFGVAITAIALGGIRGSARASLMLMVVKIIFVAGFVAVGAAFVGPARLAAPSPLPGPSALAQAILLYVYAYTGFEKAGIVAGEARDPQRDVPWALLVGVSTATLAFGGVLMVCIGVLGDPSGNDRPLAEVGRRLFGSAGAAVVSLGAIAVIVGVIQIGIVTTPRMLLALSEQGQLPAAFGRIHPRWRTPHIAILATSIFGFALSIFGDLLTTLTFSTIARLLCYLLCFAALWRLSRRADAPAARFRLPAPGFMAAISAVIVVALVLLGAAKELPALAGALAIGFILYGGRALRQRSQSGTRANGAASSGRAI